MLLLKYFSVKSYGPTKKWYKYHFQYFLHMYVRIFPSSLLCKNCNHVWVCSSADACEILRVRSITVCCEQKFISLPYCLFASMNAVAHALTLYHILLENSTWNNLLREIFHSLWWNWVKFVISCQLHKHAFHKLLFS